MSRAVMQQALEALHDPWSVGPEGVANAIAALRAALAESVTEAWREFASDYERGVIDGMAKQAESSVDRAVNALAKPQTTHWEGCEAVHPECKEKKK